MDFKSMDISTVMTGTGSDGVRYLQYFLKEYTALFGERVNPGCGNCVTTYLNKYKNHFIEMENQCKYRLHAKYENIPLEFGSPILVNNGNMTNEYALKLLEHKNGDRYFAVMPNQPFNIGPEEKPAKKMKVRGNGSVLKAKANISKKIVPDENSPVRSMEAINALE
ncbi:MAG: hypothetical protein EOO85_03900 [Pedobacter sp.]|nr:MAG: hypothetical protein EOO85_03900 [Pedobacter sp.]